MADQYLSLTNLEQYSNEQVGAACKALLLTWIITADECREGEPVSKLAHGYDALLAGQALGRDTELLMHQVGYCDNAGAGDHDVDQPTTEQHLRTIGAGNEIINLIRYIFRHVDLTMDHSW